MNKRFRYFMRYRAGAVNTRGLVFAPGYGWSVRGIPPIANPGGTWTYPIFKGCFVRIGSN